MPQYTWPARGTRPWDDQLKAIVDSINAEVDGRLGGTSLNDTYAHLENGVLMIGGVAVGGSAGAHTHPTSDIIGLVESLAALAPLASPALTGNPTAPTPTAGDADTSIATTGFVAAAISALLDSAPATLDTLNELAAALGDDPNFATTVTNAIAGKANAVHSHAISDVTGLQTALNGKAATAHSHAVSDVTGLQGLLDGKAAASHSHAIGDVAGLQGALDAKLAAGDAPELIRDTVGAALVSGANVTITPNDAGDQITIAASGGGGGGAMPSSGSRVSILTNGSSVSQTYAGWITLYPVFIPQTFTLSSIIIENAGVSDSMGFALYDCPAIGSGTANRVANFGSVSLASTGRQSLSGTHVFPAGRYYLANLVLGVNVDIVVAGGPGTTGLVTPLIIGSQLTPGKRYLSHSGSSAFPATITEWNENGGDYSNVFPAWAGVIA